MYKMLYIPGHHRSDITGLVPEHIVIAEAELDRPLEKGEIVHHKDFNKLNNEPSNLFLTLTRQEHQKLPEYQARFIIAKGLYPKFIQWWVMEKISDMENTKIRETERKLVKAQNERERLKKHTNSD